MPGARCSPLLGLLTALAGCRAPDADSGGVDSEGETPDGGTTDTGPTGDTADTGDTPMGSALLETRGAAVVFDTWQGTEDLVLTADDGDGEELCRVVLTLNSTGARADCAECIWAFDVEVAAVSSPVGDRCDIAGLDSTDTLLGSTRAMGYCPDYFGHAPVLMALDGETWIAVDFSYWDEGTGAFLYTLDGGYHLY